MTTTIQDLIDAHPDIPIDLPKETTNTSLDETYNLSPTTLVPENTSPLAIARPQTAAQVAQLVRYASQRGLPVTVRSGGHDAHRRSMASGALVLDIRALNSVRISEDRTRATVGGGITTGALTAVLEPAGLITTYPAVATVGYVGWATTGGYGLLSARYGLGVDQIVGARVVNAKGEIVEADSEILSALRGGGAGAWGVVVEMDVRVYENTGPLYGTVSFSSQNPEQDFTSFFQRLQKAQDENPEYPRDELGVGWLITVDPEFGPVLHSLFSWSSGDHERGYRWRENLRDYGPSSLVSDNVHPMPTTVWQGIVTNMLPKRVYGSARSMTVRRLTEDVLRTIVECMEIMPKDPGVGVVIQQCRGAAQDYHDKNMAFAFRDIPHFMIELVGTPSVPELHDAAEKWSSTLEEKLAQLKDVALGPYTSMTNPSPEGMRKAYGQERWERLVALKKRIDPGNVFRYGFVRVD